VFLRRKLFLQGGQGGAVKLGITTGYDKEGIGVVRKGFANDTPGFLLGFGGNRTGIHHQDIRGSRPGKQAKPFGLKRSGNSLAFKLIEFAP
jgi:hypothetical protein